LENQHKKASLHLSKHMPVEYNYLLPALVLKNENKHAYLLKHMNI